MEGVLGWGWGWKECWGGGGGGSGRRGTTKRILGDKSKPLQGRRGGQGSFSLTVIGYCFAQYGSRVRFHVPIFSQENTNTTRTPVRAVSGQGGIIWSGWYCLVSVELSGQGGTIRSGFTIWSGSEWHYLVRPVLSGQRSG